MCDRHRASRRTPCQQQQQQPDHDGLASLSLPCYHYLLHHPCYSVHRGCCCGGGSILITVRQRLMIHGECAILLLLVTNTEACGQRAFQRRPPVKAFLARRVYAVSIKDSNPVPCRLQRKFFPGTAFDEAA